MAKTKRKRRIHISNVLKGDRYLVMWLMKRRRFMLFVVLLGIIYITHNNAVRTTALQQQALRDSLSNVKAEAMAITAEWLRISSLTGVKREIKRRNINLHEPTQPPIILRNNE
jgi:hypothetical protein